MKKRRIPYKLKREIHIRDRFVCQNCGKTGQWDGRFAFEYEGYMDFDCTVPKPVRFEVDHILPEALGGATASENLQLLCRSCNRKKGSKRR